jgi:hypothetical protein
MSLGRFQGQSTKVLSLRGDMDITKVSNGVDPDLISTRLRGPRTDPPDW